MWARKRLDIGWLDLTYAAGACLWPMRRQKLAGSLAAQWSPGGDALACLSARSAFDLLLSALSLPPGAEVLISAVTIADMVRIVEAHGLVPVPVELTDDFVPDLDRMAVAVTPSTRVILVAHLFGARYPLDAIHAIARQNGLLVIEDCAQAYDGPGYTGDPRALASLFSFGTIKSSTALGGALVCVRRPETLARMRKLQAGFPVQGRLEMLRRVGKHVMLKALSGPLAYGLLCAACRLRGVDLDRLVNGSVRGFASGASQARIRRQPSAPLLALLRRRLRGDSARSLERRQAIGRWLAERLRGRAYCPGVDLPQHSHWVFPVCAAQPRKLISTLAKAGIDATQGQSLIVVSAPADRPQLDPQRTRATMGRIVFVPCYSELPQAIVELLADVVVEHERRTATPPASRLAEADKQIASSVTPV